MTAYGPDHSAAATVVRASRKMATQDYADNFNHLWLYVKNESTASVIMDRPSAIHVKQTG